jgi:Xaa-Pro aminopeptidase
MHGVLRELLDELEAAALLVVASSSQDPDIAPFSGAARIGECLVVGPPDELRLGFLSPIEREEAALSPLPLLEPASLEVARAGRQCESSGAFWSWVIARALQQAGVAPGRVALAGHFASGDLEEALGDLRSQGWSFVSGHRAVMRLRKRKSEEELTEIREVAQSTCDAFRLTARVLAAAAPRGDELWWRESRLTVGTLRREIALHFAAAGLSQPEGSLIAPGRQGAVPHNTGFDDTVLAPGQSLIVDLFPSRRLYADCTRTFCVGDAPAELVAGHAEVLGALELASHATRPGARGWDLQEAVCQHFEAAGRATVLGTPGTEEGYVHGLGHGVGYDVHEYPEFRRESPDSIGTLESGDVVTLEPGLYYPDAGWAVRLEDLLVVGQSELENLTPLPYDLDPRAWP